jgi:hypothetical protein
MRFAFVAVLALPALAACVSNAPVEGVVQGTGEKFAGVARGDLSTGGAVEITSERTTCRGTFEVVGGRRGRGVFTCADGRTGPFEFVESGRGRATGTFLTQPFIVTFS